MSDHLQTTPRGFQHVWKRVKNQAEVQATATFATINHTPTAPDAGGTEEHLPRVDHMMTLGDVLGFGGNGEVVAATQASLHRTIAVKRPREGASMRRRLLREAWVIGYLEHPNIPPVHFVGADADQQLLVGLKRIEGETLTARLARERGLENLDENLDILIQVCHAVGFAHARGVLHLDVKPDNVMTGHFGEVYLLDWGLATAFGDHHVPGLEREVGANHARGTPAFLAPEMITNESVGPATDVYLLGGLLHYVITRKPPNAGDSALEAMQAAYEPPPRVFGAEVPEPLAEICRRALAPKPADRFADADALRHALIEFRRDRRGHEAQASARRQLARVARLVGAPDSEPAAVYQAYGAARQAIEEVARADSSGKSRSLLQRVLEQLIEWELNRDNLGGAELLLSELPSANKALAARCEALRDGRQSAVEALNALRVEIDPRVGTDQKVGVLAGIGVTIAALEIVPYVLEIPPTASRVFYGYVVYMVVLTLLTYAVRNMLLNTRVNRALMSTVWVLSLFGLITRAVAFADMIPLHVAVGLDLVMVSIMEIYVGLNLDRRIAIGLPAYAAGAIVAFTLPELALVAFGLSHAIGLTLIAITIHRAATRG